MRIPCIKSSLVWKSKLSENSGGTDGEHRAMLASARLWCNITSEWFNTHSWKRKHYQENNKCAL